MAGVRVTEWDAADHLIAWEKENPDNWTRPELVSGWGDVTPEQVRAAFDAWEPTSPPDAILRSHLWHAAVGAGLITDEERPSVRPEES